MPAFSPLLIPLMTRSGARGQNWLTPIFTQSAGLPATAQPHRRSPPGGSSWNISFTVSGVK